MSDAIHPLRDPARSGVYRTASEAALESAVRGTGAPLSRIALGNASTKEAVLQAIARALDFPAWFGGNWDALEDCLTDLSWRPAAGYLLAFDGAGGLAPDELGVLLDILSSAAAYWAGKDIPFVALFVDPRGALSLPEIPVPA